MRVIPEDDKVIVDGVNVAKKHQKAHPGHDAGRHHRQGHADPRVQRRADRARLTASRPASATASTPTARRSAICRKCGSGRLMSRHRPPHDARASRRATTTRSAAQLKEELGLGNVMQVPRLDEDRPQLGVGEAIAAAVAARGRGHRPHASSPARSRSSPRPRSRSPASSSARATPSAPRSRCGATACGSSSTGSSAWRSPASATSAASTPTSFDGRGNYTFGVTEQLIFPEIDYDKIDTVRGMDITIVTTARTDDEGRALLDAFGFPFRREGQE